MRLPDGWTVDINSLQSNDNLFIKDRFDFGTFPDQLLNTLSMNVLVTSFELIRRSFVLEWFVNVGDVLKASFSFQPRLERRSTYSRKTTGTVRLVHTSGAWVLIDLEHYERLVMDPSKFITFSLDNGMNWKRYLDTGAMLWPAIRALIFKTKYSRNNYTE